MIIEYNKKLMLESYFENIGPAGGGGQVKLWHRLVVYFCGELVTRRRLGVLRLGDCGGSSVGSCSNFLFN